MTEDTRPLAGRELLLVVGGGIAAYKSAVLVRELQRLGAGVQTVLTAAGARFVTPVTFAGLTGRATRTDLWDPSHPGELHIDLTSRADALVVAPATADLLARASLGLADDLATTCLLAWQGPLVLAPAMHPRMWHQPATQEHLARLRARGATVCGPTEGPLASGEVGMGRMSEPEELAKAVCAALSAPRDLQGRRVLVTAGPTHEPMDPVRFVGNRSSGRMGFAVAERARDRGATVTLVTGPVSLPDPQGVRTVRVRTARELFDATVPEAPHHDIVVMAAAVADYRPADIAPEKIKKTQGELVLRLVKNPDVLAELGARRGDQPLPVLVGFAVESTDLVTYAREKLARKRCDLVVANLAEHGFEGADNLVTLVRKDSEEALPRLPKTAVADKILDAARELLAARHGT
ncbi:MAG: bifunctional phosphopantothenoylcysteine decarboxylase/phosphopantothenate--cysteine ligase CoaBC [Deltaproteobacteria bacterium]|nr:bifunctional phosphopantothenoylcysteine decarboxylase/phosphopantothenate--cysteine ligase CoaBC [Deltaproteobacteria bacterium]